MRFDRIRQMPVLELGISQLYLSEEKLARVRTWLSPDTIARCQPLPVHDFGNGRYTLTDGHTRAFAAFSMGILELPVLYDEDEIIIKEPGPTLYREDIRWCERFSLCTVADLSQRILSAVDYEKRWIERCERSFHLLTKTTEQERTAFQKLGRGFFLYGASPDLKILYFEDAQGILWTYSQGIFAKETEC